VSLVQAELDKYTELDTFLRGPDPGINGEGTGGGDFFLFSSFSFHSISPSPHEWRQTASMQLPG